MAPRNNLNSYAPHNQPTREVNEILSQLEQQEAQLTDVCRRTTSVLTKSGDRISHVFQRTYEKCHSDRPLAAKD